MTQQNDNKGSIPGIFYYAQAPIFYREKSHSEAQ